MSKMNLTNRTAIITGAGNGIGQAIAVALAQRQCNVILTDINEQGLEKTAAMVQPFGVQTRCSRVDVGDPESIAAFADQMHAQYQQLDVLVNNAGVSTGGTFEQLEAADYEWLIDINFYGVVRMTRAFLPLLHRSDDARIVNISSIFGIIAPPGQTAYAASKFAVRGFSESLRHELLGSTVGVTQVHPGGVNTDIARNARVAKAATHEQIAAEQAEFQRLLTLPPQVAGETIVRGMTQRRDRIIVGSDARAIAAIARMFPVRYWRILQRLI